VNHATEGIDVMEQARPVGAATVAPTAASIVRNRNFWFAVIFLILAVDHADRFLVSAVVPSVKEEFGLSDAGVGLMSGMLHIGLGLLALPAGMLVDRFSRKYMIFIMTTIWSAATWTTGLAKGYGGLLVSRLAVGAGEAGYNPAGYALIGAWYPQKVRGTMVGLFNVAQTLGSGLGIAIVGYLTLHYGWRSAFGVMALPGFILATFMLFAPDYKTVKVDSGGIREIKAGPIETLRFIVGTRTLLLIYLVQLPISFYVYSIGTWATAFYMRSYHLDVGQATRAIGVITLFAAMGPPAGGWLSDRLTRRNPSGRITVAMLFLAAPLLFMSINFLGAAAGLPLSAAVAAGCAGQFFIAGHWGTLIAAGLDLVPPHYRGTCQSFLPLFQSLTAIWSSFATGLVSDNLGLPIAMEITLLLGITTGLLTLWFARRYYLVDYERQKALGSFAVETAE
jgi:MFS family permease